MKLNNLSKVLLIVAITTLAVMYIHVDIQLNETKKQLKEVNILADSLIFEILLRDNLINQSKDTIYGEEKTITNINE